MMLTKNQTIARSYELMAHNDIVLGQMQQLLPRHILQRLVHYRDPETGKAYVFLTNLPDLPAQTVADLYRQRWQIETFLRWIKRDLKIEAFYGTSGNAVLILIWTAMIAYLLLLWFQLRSWTGWSVLDLTRLVQNLIMERFNLWALLSPRTSDPPDYAQLTLFNLGGTC